jgi:hypothetical protein
MPDGKLLSLPIPVTQEQQKKGEKGIPYCNLKFSGQPISKIIDQLSDCRFNMRQQAHLDPDLDEERLCREPGWKPVFGQIDKAQRHLQNQKVKENDLFLFFGWFRRTRYDGDRLCYVRPKDGGEDLHVIFGWLQIGRILKVGQEDPPAWLQCHPHIVNADIDSYKKNNMIYIATEQLALEGHNLSVPGAGTFHCLKDSLQLTAPEETRRSHWCLPKWFYSEQADQRLSYHSGKNKWTLHDDHVILRTASPAQEFVLNTKYYPYAVPWVKSLFEDE